MGVCVLPEPPRNAGRTAQYADYIEEVLAHAGLRYKRIRLDDLPGHLASLRVLLTVGDAPLTDARKQALEQWVQQGGAWLSVAGVCGLETVLGVTPELPAYASWGGGTCNLGEGYLHVSGASSAAENPLASEPHPVTSSLILPLHFFGGIAVTATGADTLATALDAHQRPTRRAVLTENQFGLGCALLIAADLTGTLVRIQQGICVTRDGIAASDGTAPVSDGVLKSDDGAVLDWAFDRQDVPGVPGYRAFLEPVADQWRDLLLRAVFYLAQRQRLVLPLLWLYPRNLPAIAHLSHDTDGNTPAEGRRLLEVLKEIDARSTWCVIAPGYAPPLIEEIRAAGHELAMHYDAMSDGLPWSREQFTQQFHALTALFSDRPPITNKNHYLRWEGDTEFYGWCEALGIQLDQTKGVSKTGEAGFNFGTCHPYFPLAPDGTRHDVLELCTPTQDLEVFAPTALLAPLLSAVVRHHGVLHLLFHPAHIFKPGVADAMRMAAERVRACGMEFRTATELNQWERARRACVWTDGEQPRTMNLKPSMTLPGATILLLLAEPTTVMVNGDPLPVHEVERWGFRFQSVTFDMEREITYTLRFQQDSREEQML